MIADILRCGKWLLIDDNPECDPFLLRGCEQIEYPSFRGVKCGLAAGHFFGEDLGITDYAEEIRGCAVRAGLGVSSCNEDCTAGWVVGSFNGRGWFVFPRDSARFYIRVDGSCVSRTVDYINFGCAAK